MSIEIQISRNPADYSKSDHAYNQQKHRDIKNWMIVHLIENGIIKDKGDNRFVFSHEFECYDPKHPDRIRTDEWVMPIQKMIGTTNLIVSSPYIKGLNDDERLKNMDKYKP